VKAGRGIREIQQVGQDSASAMRHSPENFLAVQGAIVGGGVRFIGRDVTCDLGVGVPLGSGVVIPMFRLARKF
jgi:hypothetical protein